MCIPSVWDANRRRTFHQSSFAENSLLKRAFRAAVFRRCAAFDVTTKSSESHGITRGRCKPNHTCFAFMCDSDDLALHACCRTGLGTQFIDRMRNIRQDECAFWRALHARLGENRCEPSYRVCGNGGASERFRLGRSCARSAAKRDELFHLAPYVRHNLS